jgi:malonyl-CoA O-methyltransferase
MEERLEWIKLKPDHWVHWAPVHGGLEAHALLSRRYPDAGCFVVETQEDHGAYFSRATATPWWRPSRWTAKTSRLGVPPDGASQMVWANMALHMAEDPQALIAQWHRSLAVDGFLMFSCLGPDTLHELRHLYASMGWSPLSHEFTDMHDWGDMLAAAGFAEPVMDMERIVLTFETPERLLMELRGLGRNLHPERFPGLRGRQWHAQLLEAVAKMPLKLTFEVIYGHAFKPAPRLNMRAETVLSLAQMREALSQRKTYPVDS